MKMAVLSGICQDQEILLMSSRRGSVKLIKVTSDFDVSCVTAAAAVKVSVCTVEWHVRGRLCLGLDFPTAS